MLVKFTVWGKPRAKDRVAPDRRSFGGRGHVHPTKQTKAYETQVGMAAMEHFRGPAYLGPLWIGILVFVKRPKKPSYNFPVTRPDLDNYLKAVLDGMKKVAMRDDCQIVGFLHSGKFFTDLEIDERIEVTVADEGQMRAWGFLLDGGE
jgi:Holliday junction resolvase RusA-like endonuclease